MAVELAPDEREEYDGERAIYRASCASNGIRMGSPAGWASSSCARRAAKRAGARWPAYRRQRELAFAAPAKLDYFEHLLIAHRADRAIVFTQDNATAYDVSRRFLVPVITHQTKVNERSDILARLSRGSYGAVVTSQGAQRRRRRARRQRGGRALGQRLGARARAAPRAHPAQERRQARRPSTSS